LVGCLGRATNALVRSRVKRADAAGDPEGTSDSEQSASPAKPYKSSFMDVFSFVSKRLLWLGTDLLENL